MYQLGELLEEILKGISYNKQLIPSQKTCPTELHKFKVKSNIIEVVPLPPSKDWFPQQGSWPVLGVCTPQLWWLAPAPGWPILSPHSLGYKKGRNLNSGQNSPLCSSTHCFYKGCLQAKQTSQFLLHPANVQVQEGIQHSVHSAGLL